MEYGIRTRELSCSGTEAASIPAPGYPSAWLESMALTAYGNPLGYPHHHHHQLPLFLNSLQHSLQASYENAALELVQKPKKHEPPDDEDQEAKDEEEEEDEDRPSDELENEASEADSWKETQMPVLSTWMLNAYTTMLSRLSAYSAAYEAAESSNLASDSDSESDHSSYTRSRDSSPANSERPTYIISDKTTTTTTTRKKKRKPSGKPRTTNNTKGSASSESGSTTSQGKKRSLALQRVRYRYEREEYRCSLCSYACTIEKAFQRHLRAHARGTATETRVSCAVCGADRSSEVDLSKHMRRHRDNRFFCCDICIFRTVQLKKLIQHRRMHTGEKPHLCPHCSYRSARRDNLRSHVRRVHKKENLYCDTFSPRGMLLTPKLQPPSPSLEDDVHDDEDEVENDKVSVPSPAQPQQEQSADLDL